MAFEMNLRVNVAYNMKRKKIIHLAIKTRSPFNRNTKAEVNLATNFLIKTAVRRNTVLNT